MKKQFVVGLLSAGLVVAMLPGVTAAKDDGKSECKKDGWSVWAREDGSPFANQDECVSYMAEGGALAPLTFEDACSNEGGRYETDVNWKGEYVVSETCSWSGDHDTVLAQVLAIKPYCTGHFGTYIDGDITTEGWALCDSD